ncbi:integrase, catalytic region, zinc finger, CCHC-type containing protein [Tanacetum coccineum]
MFKGLLELHLQAILQLFNATTAVEKDIIARIYPKPKDQVKPILNELKIYLDFFRNLFQRGIKEMKDVLESTKNKILNIELQQVKKKSFEIQEGLQLEKLENENVSLDFQVQSLIKERDNVKLEYQKLFNSIKKTRSQTQKEMDKLIVHVSEKTYAYSAIRAEN